VCLRQPQKIQRTGKRKQKENCEQELWMNPGKTVRNGRYWRDFKSTTQIVVQWFKEMSEKVNLPNWWK
jgi:hypothetical protein